LERLNEEEVNIFFLVYKKVITSCRN